MTETRIRWDDAPDSLMAASTGSVGTLDPFMFHIWSPDSHCPEWQLTTRLPGMSGRCHYGTGPGELKAEAEQWLEEFAASLGAVFPDEAAGGLLAHAAPIRSALLNSAAAEGVSDSSRRLYFDAVEALDRELDTPKEAGQ